MGILSKVWKGVKKVAKKIGKGIKKAVYKVAEVFGKLGIVGQLALGFLMPYALGALSSMFGAIGTKVVTWAGTLAKSSNVFASAVGHGMEFVISAGRGLKTMYGKVTDMISAGVNKAKEFFGFGQTAKVDLTKAVSDDMTAQIDVDLTNTLNKRIDATGGLKPQGVDVAFNPENMATFSTDVGPTDLKSLLAGNTTEEIVGSMTENMIASNTIGTAASTTANTFGQNFIAGVKREVGKINVFDSDSQIRQDIADFSAYDYAKTTATGAVEQAVVGGAVAAGQQKIASAFGYKVPNSNQTYINLPEMQGAGRHVGKYNEATLWAQENGNNFLMQSFRPRDYVAEAFGNEDAVALYFAKMQNQFYNQDQNNTLFTGTA